MSVGVSLPSRGSFIAVAKVFFLNYKLIFSVHFFFGVALLKQAFMGQQASSTLASYLYLSTMPAPRSSKKDMPSTKAPQEEEPKAMTAEEKAAADKKATEAKKAASEKAAEEKSKKN